MPLYKENFPVGTKVRIAAEDKLQDFLRTWRFHHTLGPEQLDFASQIAEVAKVSFYHGGDVLYELRGISGVWHEACLLMP